MNQYAPRKNSENLACNDVHSIKISTSVIWIQYVAKYIKTVSLNKNILNCFIL